MKKKFISFLLSFCVLAGSVNVPASVKAEGIETTETGTTGLDAEYHTQEQIREYYRNHPVKDMEAEYITEPSVTVPYALGELTEETKQNALNMLNLYRYIAGVPEVVITDQAQDYAQAASLVMAINRRLSHTADCPAGMDKEMYALAAFGSFNSNIAGGGNKLCNNLVRYMVEANGDPNYGHRRQLLDYYYKEAGFGLAKSESGGYYSATYVDANLKEDKIISYPGQNQPLEYFGTGYAWTVVIPEKVNKDSINIKLSNTGSSEVWDFNSGLGNIRLDIDGRTTCAIFAPSNINYRDGDRYRVEITGIDNPITYDVNMFNLNDSIPLESIQFNASAYGPFEGETYIASVKYTPANASNKIVTWASSAPDIAVAEWAGTGVCNIVAKKAGTAIITATSEDGGHTASVMVNVKPKASAVELNKTNITIGVGQSFILSGKTLPQDSHDTVHYNMNYDKNIISVEDTRYAGKIKVTGKAKGETSIKAYAYSNNDAEAVCHINVVEPVYTEELRLDKTEAEIIKGETLNLNALFSPSDVTCKEIQWTSDNSYIATVEDGKVQATEETIGGKVVITAKVLDGTGKKAHCMVTIYGKYEKPEAPEVLTCSSNEVRVWSGNGCEYSIDKKTWQGNLFTGLEPDHEYTFYARKTADLYTKESDISEGTKVRTHKAEQETASPAPSGVPTTKPGATKSPSPSRTPAATQPAMPETKESPSPSRTPVATQTARPGTKESPSPSRTPAATQTAKPGTTKNPAPSSKPGNCKHTSTKIKDASKATCTKKGYTGDTYCEKCGEKTATGKEITALGHNYIKKITKQPSVKEEGITTYICSRCSDSYAEKTAKLTENNESSKDKTSKDQNTKEDDGNNIVFSGTGNGKETAPEITVKDGKKELTEGIDYKLTYENNDDTGTTTVSVTGIGNYEGTNGNVFTLNARKGSKVTINGCNYIITSSSSAAFAGISNGKVSKIIVPKTIKTGGKTYKVTSVAENALKKTKAKNVTIGANVEKIGASAFKNCKKLSNITIKSSNLKSVGKNALKGIKPGIKIKVPAKKLSAYKKLFKGKGQKGKVKFVK